MKVSDDVISYHNELIFFPYTYSCSSGQVGYPVYGFHCASTATEKYSEWPGTDDRIFMRPYIKKIPKPLKYCEELFDKDVLQIKKLVKDIGDLTPLIHKEQKKNFYIMIAILSVIHFLLNLIKRSNVMGIFHSNTTIIMGKL